MPYNSKNYEYLDSLYFIVNLMELLPEVFSWLGMVSFAAGILKFKDASQNYMEVYFYLGIVCTHTVTNKK